MSDKEKKKYPNVYWGLAHIRKYTYVGNPYNFV